MGEKIDVEDRWPELFAQLDDSQPWTVRQSLAAAWHEGWVPNREDVSDLIAEARGTISFEEYQRRSEGKAERARAGGAVAR